MKPRDAYWLSLKERRVTVLTGEHLDFVWSGDEVEKIKKWFFVEGWSVAGIAGKMNRKPLEVAILIDTLIEERKTGVPLGEGIPEFMVIPGNLTGRKRREGNARYYENRKRKKSPSVHDEGRPG